MGSPRIEYFVRREEERPAPREREDGRVDFYDLRLIENVVAGQVLARIPLEEEIAGPEAFPMGENVYVPEDNPRVLVAAVNGHAYWKDGKLHVSPVFVIEGNVDFSTGNVVFVGKLIVKGTIRAGFSVEAEELLVEGEVEGEARSGGKMEVKGGIVTGEKGGVRCGGDLKALYVLNARVEVEGDLLVERSIRNSTVLAKGEVKVVGDPGLILGGLTKAARGVTARTIGARWGTPTEIVVGTDPFLEMEIRKLKDHEDRLRERLEQLKDRPEEARALQGRMEEVSLRRAILEGALHEHHEAYISVEEGIYHGSKLVIGKASLTLTEDFVGRMRFVERAGVAQRA